MKKSPSFYKDRVSLNVLAHSVTNALECYEAAEGNILLGILSKNYNSVETAIEDMKKYQIVTNNSISVGLGAGDPNQSKMVMLISKKLQPQHVNQVFTGVGMTRNALNQDETIINGLVSPTGRVGYVNIATGPISSRSGVAEIPVETAIALLKDMGGSSIKYFPMKGIAFLEEYKYVAEACAKNDFILEPTGGIDLDNFRKILEIAVDSGVKKIIPHIYSSIIDSKTGNTEPKLVGQLYKIVQKVLSN